MSRCFIVFLTNQKDYEPFSAANSIAVVCGVCRSVAGWCRLRVAGGSPPTACGDKVAGCSMLDAVNWCGVFGA